MGVQEPILAVPLQHLIDLDSFLLYTKASYIITEVILVVGCGFGYKV